MKVAIAFLDANVMYSRTLCDWIFQLRLELPGMFRVYSSADAIDETTYNLRRNKPRADGDAIERRRAHFRKFLDEIVTDFPGDVEFAGSDENDRHIHAAATNVSADYLITDDSGFESFDNDEACYEAHTADTFLCLIGENAPSAVQEVMVRQLAYWSARPGSRTLADALRNAGCPKFARKVEASLQALSEGRSLHSILTDLG